MAQSTEEKCVCVGGKGRTDTACNYCQDRQRRATKRNRKTDNTHCGNCGEKGHSVRTCENMKGVKQGK